ncbi:FxLYD domain-containing protein [Leptotrichia sp. oral taxon 223]|uniref:FxLYD domain-containing protein n=1 Tax=Leptotrichia sp. oral taxon 223 TaxID=712363 RepID=UPI0015BBA66A|nr:FxLYD domain-containing protein [Leptotrichia sp. oral taxon 223]NWO18873.1 hypothetical protein [Leptotrichia sp. oral taxon 223]
MKKRVGLILGCVLFVISAVGSVSGDKKDNASVSEKGNATKQETKENAKEAKKEYEIENVDIEKDEFSTYVTGVLKNNGGKKGYVQITVPCYDKNGAKLGDALANVNDIEANGKWKFKAIYMGSETPASCDVNKLEVSGF